MFSFTYFQQINNILLNSNEDVKENTFTKKVNKTVSRLSFHPRREPMAKDLAVAQNQAKIIPAFNHKACGLAAFYSSLWDS